MKKYVLRLLPAFLLAICLVFSYVNIPAALAADEVVCTCNTQNDTHTTDCALMAATENQTSCTCTPVDGVHQESCSLYVSPDDDTSEGPIMSAGIYLDADRQTLLSDMTYSGSTLTGWTYNNDNYTVEDRYLGINLSQLSMDSDKQYQLVVEMDPILYINQTTEPSLNHTTVTFTRNEAFTVNGDGSYEPYRYSLSNLTYLIDSGEQSLPVVLPLRFDINLWNKQDGANLGDGTNPLLHVYLQEKQADGSFVTISGCDVKLLQATVSGTLPYNPSVSMYIVGGSSTATTKMGPEDSLKFNYSMFSSNYTEGHYVSSLEINIKIPTCTYNDTTYRMQYTEFGLKTTTGNQTFYEQTFDENTGVLTIKASNVFLSSNGLFNITFTAPEELKNLPGSYVFSGEATVVSDNTYVSQNRAFTITLDTASEAILKTHGTNGSANCLENDTVQFLGNLAIRNDAATAGSGSMLISLSFDINETNAVSVTTVNLMCDRDSENITIYYTLQNKDGTSAFPDETTGENTVFSAEVKNKHYSPGGNISDSNYQTFTRNDLPEEHRNYFFETLSYTMGNLPGNSSAYHTGASRAPYSAGTIWGYVNVNEIPEIAPKHSMTVYRLNSDESQGDVLLNKEITVNINEGTSVPYGLDSAKCSSTNLTSGDSFTISGDVFVIRYPYTSNSCLNDIMLGFVLPQGIKVNESSITASYTGGTLEVDAVTTKSLDNGKNMHIIKFKEGQKIGHFDEELGTLETGDRVKFSVQFNSDKSMSAQSIVLRESVFVAGKDRENGAGGSYSGNAITDTYDLNENNSVTDKIGCLKNSTDITITFQSPPAELIITDTLTDNDGNSGSELAMESFADVLNYELKFECTQGGSATDFFYMIPIGKTDMTKESTFVSKCQVNIALSGAASVTTTNGTAMKIFYSNADIDDYDGALLIGNEYWYETLPTGVTWDQITVIKVEAAEDEIVNGSVNTISVPLKYAGTDTEYQNMAGYQIEWSSRGYYCYALGYGSYSATRSTDGCTVTLTYTPQETVKFTLTAAKAGNPSSGTKTYELDLQVQFYLAQEYRVKQITPSNVNLMGAEYNFENATSTEANENFRINISVKKKDDTSASTSVALQKDNDIIGSLGENSVPVFTFTIENADALSDIVTDRKVTLTLIGSNGVIVPVEITIARELAEAEATESAIVAGRLYSPFIGTTSATVGSDSAFTAQFVTQYIPANYTGHKIVFTSAPVKDTTVTLIDYTFANSLKFYHYTMDGSTSTVSLTDFVCMGSSEKFSESSVTDEVKEQLLFIVSFPEGGETVRDNSVKLTKTLNTSSTSEESSSLSFTTVAKRTFSLSSSQTSVKNGADFTLSYTSQCNISADSRYSGKQLSLVLSPADSTSFSADSCLVVDDTSYYLNAQGCFMIPLKPVQSGDGTVNVACYSETADEISLNAYLWASATANGSKPLMGDEVADAVTVNVTPYELPSFKVTDMSDRLIEKEELSDEIKVSFSKSDNVTAVTIELQKKISADYTTQTTILESVNGVTQATSGQGVFSVTGDDAELKLSRTTEVGTYRLLFTVSSNDATITVPYNFVVVE